MILAKEIFVEGADFSLLVCWLDPHSAEGKSSCGIRKTYRCNPSTLSISLLRTDDLFAAWPAWSARER